MKKRFLTMAILSLLFVVVACDDNGISPSVGGDFTAVQPIPVISGDTLAAQLQWLQDNAESDKNYTLVPPAALEEIVPHTLSYTGRNNITIQLKSAGGEKIVALSENGSLFTVESGVTLILDNGVTLRGHDCNDASLITVNGGGTLIMNMGAKITGNTSNYSNTHGGGGVFVLYEGVFIMNGGEITGNSIGYTIYPPSGGGVKVYGTFTMNGGVINGNRADGWEGGGGGVYVASEFTMSGGKISGNDTDGRGGGVQVSTGSTFNMLGGEITGNTAASGGGGVDVYSGTVNMLGGEINNNTTTWYGGGVYMQASATFNMLGGKIAYNTAVLGGGVCNWGGPFNVFTMEAGEIAGNTAMGGGGVYWGKFTKTGGTVYGYNASDLINSNTVKDESGTVINDRGHAVYLDENNRRETTAGPEVNLNWATAGAAGGWEN